MPHLGKQEDSAFRVMFGCHSFDVTVTPLPHHQMCCVIGNTCLAVHLPTCFVCIDASTWTTGLHLIFNIEWHLIVCSITVFPVVQCLLSQFQKLDFQHLFGCLVWSLKPRESIWQPYLSWLLALQQHMRCSNFWFCTLIAICKSQTNFKDHLIKIECSESKWKKESKEQLGNITIANLFAWEETNIVGLLLPVLSRTLHGAFFASYFASWQAAGLNKHLS